MLKNKMIDYILIFIIIGIFVSYFTIRESVISDNPILSKIDKIEKLIQEDNWIEAKESADNLKENWNKNKQLIYFNFGEAEVSSFTHSINTVIGGIDSEDKASSLSHLKILKDYWVNFLRIVPEP